MLHRLHLSVMYPVPVSEVFAALGRTLAFRRWAGPEPDWLESTPPAGLRYRYRGERVLREGRVVDVVRPVGITLVETLDDPPCLVSLKLRWRIEPVPTGSLARLQASYRLNYAASLRGAHWERRLRQHFGRQFSFVSAHIDPTRQPA